MPDGQLKKLEFDVNRLKLKDYKRWMRLLGSWGETPESLDELEQLLGKCTNYTYEELDDLTGAEFKELATSMMTQAKEAAEEAVPPSSEKSSKTGPAEQATTSPDGSQS